MKKIPLIILLIVTVVITSFEGISQNSSSVLLKFYPDKNGYNIKTVHPDYNVEKELIKTKELNNLDVDVIIKKELDEWFLAGYSIHNSYIDVSGSSYGISSYVTFILTKD